MQLARAARRLNQSAGSALPALVLLTDDERLADPLAAVRALPRGSLVVLRARDRDRRVALADALARLAFGHGLAWIIADDAPLAQRAGAHGAHFPEQKIASLARWRARQPHWLITSSAHSLGACIRAGRAGADAVLLGPVFATHSHPHRAGIGPVRARLIARLTGVPVYALGGVDAHSALRLAGAHLAGLAAIGGLGLDESDA